MASRLLGPAPAAAAGLAEGAATEGPAPEPSFGSSFGLAEPSASSATSSSTNRSGASASEVHITGCNPDALQTRVRLAWSSEEVNPSPSPSLSPSPHAKPKTSRYLTLTHQAARGLESPSLVRDELHRALDAVHSLFVRRALGGLCDEFAAYVPAEGRDYWRTLASASVDGMTGCMERPVSRKENAMHQLAYQP